MWSVKVNRLLVVALLALLRCNLIEWILNQRIKSIFFLIFVYHCAIYFPEVIYSRMFTIPTNKKQQQKT